MLTRGYVLEESQIMDLIFYFVKHVLNSRF